MNVSHFAVKDLRIGGSGATQFGPKTTIALNSLKWGGRVLTAGSYVGAFSTGYFIGQTIVDADNVYLHGKIVSEAGELLAPVFKIVYQITNPNDTEANVQLEEKQVHIFP